MRRLPFPSLLFGVLGVSRKTRSKSWSFRSLCDYLFSVSLPTRFDHCVVHVSDWERSSNFYRDVVGVEVVVKNGRSAYRFENAQLNLHGPGVKPHPLATIPVPPGGSDLCFEWSGAISKAAEHLKMRGVEIELGPVRRFGARGDGISIYFRDPDGSLLEFISYTEGGEVRSEIKE
jgi:catechol 2,3-dioxygenase-like lactoylglutathione lyase family enzyme